MAENQGKKNASKVVPEATESKTVTAGILTQQKHPVKHNVQDAFDEQSNPADFGVVVARLKNMTAEEFKAEKQTLADQFSGGAGMDSKDMGKLLVALRNHLGREDRALMPWEIDPKPWPEEVALLDVIRKIENIIRRVMFCEERYITAAAYYAVATWFVESVQYAPYMVITAPAKRCGKSAMLDLMSRLVRRPYIASGVLSGAATFRLIEEFKPTLLLDEVDTYLKKSEDLQGILNGGINRRTANVPRCEKDESGKFRVRSFDTFGFKIMSGIAAEGSGAALVDRAIVIRLSRKDAKEKKARQRDIPAQDWTNLQRMLMRVSIQYAEHFEKIAAHSPVMPESLGDRDCDKWEILIALADLCGEDEGKRVRNIAREIASEGSEDTWQAELLADSKEIVLKARESKQAGYTVELSAGGGGFRVSISNGGIHGDCILTATLADALTLDPERQWGTFGKTGKAMTQSLITKTMKQHGVHTCKLKSERGKSAFLIDGEHGILMVAERYGAKREEA